MVDPVFIRGDKIMTGWTLSNNIPKRIPQSREKLNQEVTAEMNTKMCINALFSVQIFSFSGFLVIFA
jgi:hypothetical protein